MLNFDDFGMKTLAGCLKQNKFMNPQEAGIQKVESQTIKWHLKLGSKNIEKSDHGMRFEAGIQNVKYSYNQTRFEACIQNV